MLAYLDGNLIFKSGDEAIIEVSGVGYGVTCTSSALPTSINIGNKIKIFIYTDVKENSISLFGFGSIKEREVFLLLKKVKGIGSKSALLVVSTLGPERVLVSIGKNDLVSLCSVPGIGKKTAERIVLELRERVTDLIEVESAGIRDVGEDVVLALERLGFSKAQAKEVVVKTVKESSLSDRGISINSGELLKMALGNL